MTDNNKGTPQVLITGGSGDLAAVMAVKLQDRGYDVLCPDKSELDVRDGDSVDSFFESKVTRHLALLINNAGKKDDELSLKMTPESWDQVISVNLRGAFLCSKLALKVFLKNRLGHIINIGSYSALSGPMGQSNYSSSKAGLIGLTKSLAVESGKRNVRVNCVLPGWMETKFTANVSENTKNRSLEEHVLKMFNNKESAAEFIIFLHEKMMSVSGQVFQLDSRISQWN